MQNFRSFPACVLRKMTRDLSRWTEGQAEKLSWLVAWNHVQVERGYFGFCTDERTDGQPKNIIPLAPQPLSCQKIGVFL